MKIGLISDIHSNSYALQELFKKEKSVNRWVCAGDICGLFPNVNEVIDMFIKNGMDCVRGNHEEVLLNSDLRIADSYTGNESVDFQRNTITIENRRYIQNLPERKKITIQGKRILVTHELQPALGKHSFDFKSIESEYSEYDIIVYGHTHLPQVVYGKRVILINPGSLGFPIDRLKNPSYALLDLETLNIEFKRVQVNNDKLVRDIAENGYNKKLSTYLVNGYEWK